MLSRGGGDAVVIREFDTVKKQFVPAGFIVPEGKTDVSWKDDNTLFVGTDFGPGTITTSGYPRITKEWKRGTPLTEAKQLAEAKDSDVAISSWRDWHQGQSLDVVERSITFFSSETFLNEGGKLTRLDKPDDAKADYFSDQLLLELRTDWKLGEKTWPAGALLAIKLKDFQAGKRDFEVLYEPAKNRSLLWMLAVASLPIGFFGFLFNKQAESTWTKSVRRCKWAA